jgi:hypothetical protein
MMTVYSGHIFRYTPISDFMKICPVGTKFLISNFCCVLYVVCFLPGNSPASETKLLHANRQVGGWMDGWMDRWMDGWMDRHIKKLAVVFLEESIWT